MIKLSKFERVAGLMIAGVIAGSVVVAVGVAIKKGWFETVVELHATFSNAEGLHSGTQVLMSGVRVGEITAVELKKDNTIDVKFVIHEKFLDRIREDSVVRLVRPFIIGDKVLDVTVGTPDAGQLLPGELVRSAETTDFMDLLSGRKLGPMLETLEGLTSNLRVLAEAFADPERVQSLIKTFDKIHPLIGKLEVMAGDITVLSRHMTKDDRLKNVLENAIVTTRAMNKILPALNEESPRLGEDIAALARNLTELTQEFRQTLPALRAVAPQLPAASQQAIVALDELVVTLRALQQSFLLSGQVDEIRKEMRIKAEKEKGMLHQPGPDRLPAGEP